MDSKARQPSEASLASRARKHIWDNPYLVLAFASLCWSGNHIVGRAITGGTLFSALQYVGLQHTTALNVSILNSLVPVLIVAAGALIFRDRIRFVQLLGISI